MSLLHYANLRIHEALGKLENINLGQLNIAMMDKGI